MKLLNIGVLAGLVCLALFGTAACTAGGRIAVDKRRAAGSGPSLPLPQQSLPELPAPHTLNTPAAERRQTASLNENGLLRGGDDFDLTLARHLSIAGASGAFSPNYAGSGGALGGLAYGLYRFDADGFDRNSDLLLRWELEPAAGQLWIGLGNQSSNRWDWFNPINPRLLSLEGAHPLSDYLSPSGELLLLVLLTGSQAASLEALRIGDPLMSLEIHSSSGRSTMLLGSGAELQSGSTIATGSIVNYEWDLDGDGDFETDTDAVSSVNPAQASQPGTSTEVSMRATSDWGTRSTVTAPFRILSGVWDLHLITDTLNNASHNTEVQTPRLLGTDAGVGEVPLVVWSQLDIDDPAGSPTYHSRLMCLRGDDPNFADWTATAAVVDKPDSPVYYTIDDVARLADGSCGVLYHQTLINELYYADSTDAQATSWNEPDTLGFDIVSSFAGSLTVIGGDLYCIDTHGGSAELRRRPGTKGTWESSSTIYTGDSTLSPFSRAALVQGLNGNGDVRCYALLQGFSNFQSAQVAAFCSADSPGGSFQLKGQLSGSSVSGDYMNGAMYLSPQTGQIRALAAYYDHNNSDIYYNLDMGADIAGELASAAALGLGEPVGELHLRGSLDNASNLADVLLVDSRFDGGLLSRCYTEGNGWAEPAGSGSGVIEVEQAGSPGLQPHCAWVEGRPAVVYLEGQNLKFAIMN